MDRAEIASEIAAGRLAVVRRPWAGEVGVWFEDGGQLWWLEAGEHLGRLDPVTDPERLPPAITGWITELTTEDDALIARCRATLAEARQLHAALEDGAWFWIDPHRPIAPGGRLGRLRFRVEPGPEGEVSITWLTRDRGAFSEMASAVWRRDSKLLAGEADVYAPHTAPPPPAVAEALSTAVAEVLADLDAVAAGTHLYGTLGPDGGRGFLFAGGRWLHVRVGADGHLDPSALFNPWYLVHDREKVIDRILDRRRNTYASAGIHPLPPALHDDWEALEAAFALPKQAIVERYLDRIRDGGTISGGPTTDQSWTVRWQDGGFTISGYADDDGDGLRPVVDPLPEERLRRMLETYHMFGLHRMEE